MRERCRSNESYRPQESCPAFCKLKLGFCFWASVSGLLFLFGNVLFPPPGRGCVKLANAVPASLEPLHHRLKVFRMFDRMYPTTANSTGRWQRAGYGSLAPEIVSRIDS